MALPGHHSELSLIYIIYVVRPYRAYTELSHNAEGELTGESAPSAASTYLPRPLHAPECFTVSTLCTYESRQSKKFGCLTTL